MENKSIKNKILIEKSKYACCYFCRERFSVSEIHEWIDNNQTALCPRCDMDTVLGDEGGDLPVPSVIKSLQEKFFK